MFSLPLSAKGREIYSLFFSRILLVLLIQSLINLVILLQLSALNLEENMNKQKHTLSYIKKVSMTLRKCITRYKTFFKFCQPPILFFTNNKQNYSCTCSDLQLKNNKIFVVSIEKEIVLCYLIYSNFECFDSHIFHNLL